MERQKAPHLAAYYWNGAHAVPHSVRDLSAAGAYLVTEERWHPGTILMLTLQNMDKNAHGLSGSSVRVQSKVVRSDTDGVGLEFVFPSKADSGRGDASLHGADRKMLANFVRANG